MTLQRTRIKRRRRRRRQVQSNAKSHEEDGWKRDVLVSLLLYYMSTSRIVVGTDTTVDDRVDEIKSVTESQRHRRLLGNDQTLGRSSSLLLEQLIKIPLDSNSAIEDFFSTTHCVGENFDNHDDTSPTASFRFRSCQFRNLCWNNADQSFVVFPSKEEEELQTWLDSWAQFSPQQQQQQQQAQPTLNMGGDLMITLSTTTREKHVTLDHQKWFPKVTSRIQLPNHYWTLSETYQSHIVIPFSLQESTVNPSLLWDDETTADTKVRRHRRQVQEAIIVWGTLLPIVTLLHIFGLEEHPLVLMELVNNDQQQLCSSDTSSHHQACQILQIYLAAMGLEPAQLVSKTALTKSLVELGEDDGVLCFRYAAAGLTMMMHQSDPGATHMVGQGASFWTFRNWMLGHLGLPTSLSYESSLAVPPPWKITFVFSDTDEESSFAGEIRAVKTKFQSTTLSVSIDVHRIDSMDLASQAKLASESFILVTSSKTVLSTFLPPGSCLVAYVESPQDSGAAESTTLDSQYIGLLKMAGYFRTHLVAPKLIGSDESFDYLVALISKELELVQAKNEKI